MSIDSELESQAHLQLPRIAHRTGNRAHLRVADVRVGQSELRMIEDVERFGAELEPGLLANHESS